MNQQPSTAFVIGQEAGFSPEHIEIIKGQICPPGTTDAELALFLMYCQKTGLDPLARQIYLSERRSKDRNGNWIVTRKPETTIDGFRLVAERTGKYCGQIGPLFCGPDGQWTDAWLKNEPPSAAKIGVLRDDFKEPLFAVALYREYVQVTQEGKPNSMWGKMPTNQLGKCSEASALRRAFPRELSGLYTTDEMDQSENEASPAEEKKDNPYMRGLEAPATVITGLNNPTQKQQTGAKAGEKKDEVGGAPVAPSAKATTAPSTSPSPAPEPPPSNVVSSDNPKHPENKERFAKMLTAFQEQKQRLGAKTYYDILGASCHEHSNDFTSLKEAIRVFKLMSETFVIPPPKTYVASDDDLPGNMVPYKKQLAAMLDEISLLYDKKSQDAVKKLLSAFLSGYYSGKVPDPDAANIGAMRVTLNLMRGVLEQYAPSIVESAARAKTTGNQVAEGVRKCASYLAGRSADAQTAFWDMAAVRFPDSGGADIFDTAIVPPREMKDEDFIAYMRLATRRVTGLSDLLDHVKQTGVSVAKIIDSWATDIATCPIPGLEALIKGALQVQPQQEPTQTTEPAATEETPAEDGPEDPFDLDDWTK